MRWPKELHYPEETFPLRFYEFGPLFIKGPRLPKGYLKRMYGQWVTPKITFHAYADNDPLWPKMLTLVGRKVKSHRIDPAYPRPVIASDPPRTKKEKKSMPPKRLTKPS